MANTHEITNPRMAGQASVIRSSVIKTNNTLLQKKAQLARAMRVIAVHSQLSLAICNPIADVEAHMNFGLPFDR